MKHIYLLLVTLGTISTTLSQVIKNENPKPKIVMNKKEVIDNTIWFNVKDELFNLVGFELG